MTPRRQTARGWLTRANFLASRAHQLEGSPPLRSVFILERLFCSRRPPRRPMPTCPSPGPARARCRLKTNRELFQARIAPAACNACHSAIDTIGYGLEHYDAIGGYRADRQRAAGQRARQIKGTDVDGAFTGGVELSQKLAASKTLQICLARNWYRIRGRPGAGDRGSMPPGQAGGHPGALGSGGDVRELLVALVKSPEFIYRTPIVP